MNVLSICTIISYRGQGPGGAQQPQIQQYKAPQILKTPSDQSVKEKQSARFDIQVTVLTRKISAIVNLFVSRLLADLHRKSNGIGPMERHCKMDKNTRCSKHKMGTML